MRNPDIWQAERERATVLTNGLKILMGKDSLLIWKPRGKNPYYNYYFRNPARIENALKEEIEKYDNHLAWKESRKIKRAFNENDKDAVKVGDLYYTSWGYDQTNYDYIVVTEISATGKTVKARRTKHDHVGETAQCNIQKPINAPFGDIFRLKVEKCTRNGNTEYHLRGSYPFCYDASMKNKRMGSFWPVEDNATFQETDSMFGH